MFGGASFSLLNICAQSVPEVPADSLGPASIEFTVIPTPQRCAIPMAQRSHLKNPKDGEIVIARPAVMVVV